MALGRMFANPIGLNLGLKRLLRKRHCEPRRGRLEVMRQYRHYVGMAYLGLNAHFASEPPMELLSLLGVCYLRVEGLAGKPLSAGRSHLVHDAEATAVNQSKDFQGSLQRVIAEQAPRSVSQQQPQT